MHIKNSLLFTTIAIMCLSCNSIRTNPSKRISVISFQTEAKNKDIRFFYPNVTEDTLLQNLKKQYPIEEAVKNAKNDYEKVLLAMAWVRGRWEHNGDNDAKTTNACIILERAEKGEKFRCVEYGYVLKSVLNALGLKARSLGLRTRDVETTRYGAGHVLTEVWLNDYQKWVMVDPQFNAMPILDSMPLSGVELQATIIQKKPFQFINSKGYLTAKETKAYMDFIPHYLYYFDVVMDSRNNKKEDKFNINGNYDLMLVPISAKNPTIFQIKYPIKKVIYTNSIKDFYQKP